MSPINSNGSKLKVFTVIGGSVMLNEEAGRANYGQNQQREEKRQAGTHPMDVHVYGHDKHQQDIEPPVDEEIQAAVDKDLQKRNLKTTPTD